MQEEVLTEIEQYLDQPQPPSQVWAPSEHAVPEIADDAVEAEASMVEPPQERPYEHVVPDFQSPQMMWDEVPSLGDNPDQLEALSRLFGDTPDGSFYELDLSAIDAEFTQEGWGMSLDTRMLGDKDRI